MRGAASEERIVPEGPARQVLEIARGAGLEARSGVWWVGGGVRDLLRGAAELDLDLDLVVEDNLDAFLSALSAHGGKVVARSRFLTAELRLGATRLDVAQARRESYPMPSALPVVEEGTIEEDLGRRDFTVNAMAISVAPEIGARLLDPHGGQSDLHARRLRILHPLSFEDDPTRMLRAIDFSARFGFILEPVTEATARAALAGDGFRRLSPRRLRTALERTLSRPHTVVAALDLARALGALQAIDRGLCWDSASRTLLIRSLAVLGHELGAPASSRDCFLLALLALIAEAGAEVGLRLARTLDFQGAGTAIVSGYETRCGEARRLGPSAPASHAHRLLRTLEPVELAHVAAQREDLAAWVRREIELLRPLRLAISGDDLRRRGVAEGPKLGQALQRTLDARLDGDIGAAEELDFALAAMRREESAP